MEGLDGNPALHLFMLSLFPCVTTPELALALDGRFSVGAKPKEIRDSDLPKREPLG